MARRYGWESSSDSGSGRFPWERDSSGSSSNGSDPDGDDPNSDAYAVSRFLKMLDLYDGNDRVTAEKVCVLCFWIGKVVPGNAVKRYGKGPGLGNYQRHLDPLIGMDDDQAMTYQLEVVGNRRRDLARTQVDLLVRPIHEVLRREFDADASDRNGN